MGDENIREVHRQLRVSQDKYTYFILAVAGAAVALAIRETHGTAIAWPHLLVGLAVLCWGLSFFCGCRHIEYVNATLYANGDLLKVQNGIHPEYNTNPQNALVAVEAIREAVASNSVKSGNLARWQFKFLIIGALFYIGWHIWGMVLLALVPTK
ncbi:MAG: hypothetical protein ABFD08_05760 [Syntrophomonas sp.]